MATVRLSEFEALEELPAVCMQCGAPATVWKSNKFSWTPSWVLVLFLCGLLPLLIVYLITNKRMKVIVPFCDEHQDHFAWRRRFVAVGLFCIACLGVSAIIAVSQLPNGQDLSGYLCGGGAVIALVWLIWAALVSSSGIRPSEITDYDITLTNVSREFKDALNEDRDRDEEAHRARRAERRARREREDQERPPLRDRDEERFDDA
jgi:hypothetical protein